MRNLLEDPTVDEIAAIDFTHDDYHAGLEHLYGTQVMTVPINSINRYYLGSDMELTQPNRRIFFHDELINEPLEAMGRDSTDIDAETVCRKPVQISKPKNLESMTSSPKDGKAQRN